jgi:hypothetical protein
MSEQVRREFTLDVPAAKLHQAINDALRTNNSRYLLKSKNETFGSYSVSLIKNLYVLAATITVSAVTEAQTRFELSALPGQQLQKMPGMVSGMIEEFLQVVGDFATGKLIVREVMQSKGRQRAKSSWGGPLTIIFITIIIAVLMYFMWGR